MGEEHAGHQTSDDGIWISGDPILLKKLDQAAELMGISRSDLILHILRLWEKNQNLPLNGTDRLCSLTPESR